MGGGELRVLALGLFPRGLAPAQRFRVEQYIPALERLGVRVVLSEPMSRYEYLHYRDRRRWWLRARVVAKQVVWRLMDVLRAGGYDVVLVQREASFLPTVFFERLVARKVPMVYDFDDAIWMPQPESSFASRRRARKVAELIGMADAVIAGNDFLAGYARQFSRRVWVLPAGVDTDVFKPAEWKRKGDGKVVLGWIGSEATTRANFWQFLEVWRAVRQALGDRIEFLVVGAEVFDPVAGIRGVPFDHVASLREQEYYQSVDVGLAPLPDTPWSLGKCAQKVINYMAVGVPVVASPVGENARVVRHGVTGFLARTAEEWVKYISLLVEDKQLRRRMGAAGRQYVERERSVRVLAPRLAEILLSVV